MPYSFCVDSRIVEFLPSLSTASWKIAIFSPSYLLRDAIIGVVVIDAACLLSSSLN